MSKIKTTTAYIEVPVSEARTLWVIDSHLFNVGVEKKENQVLLSKEDFLKAIGDAFDAGFKKCGENMVYHMIEISNPAPDKEQYINNLIEQP